MTLFWYVYDLCDAIVRVDSAWWCWWPGAYLKRGHLQPLWWRRQTSGVTNAQITLSTSFISDTCVEDHVTRHGLVSSPSYPGQYDPGVDLCLARLRGPPGSLVIFQLTHMDVEKSFECMYDVLSVSICVMTSSYRNILPVTGPLWGESTGGFPAQRLVTQNFVVFLWFAPEQTVEQSVELPVLWDAMMSMWQYCNGLFATYHI